MHAATVTGPEVEGLGGFHYGALVVEFLPTFPPHDMWVISSGNTSNSFPVWEARTSDGWC
jgi:hypothetical protein